MVYFAPSFASFRCPHGRRRRLRFRILPIAGRILFHGIGPYVSKDSIGLQLDAVGR